MKSDRFGNINYKRKAISFRVNINYQIKTKTNIVFLF